MDYDSTFRTHLEHLRSDGNYRVFAEVERRRGEFPRARRYREGTASDITVWCSNDYLGMGQHPKVIAAMHEAIDRGGAGAGGTRNISGTTHEHGFWRPSWPTCMARRRRSYSPPATFLTSPRWARSALDWKAA